MVNDLSHIAMQKLDLFLKSDIIQLLTLREEKIEVAGEDETVLRLNFPEYFRPTSQLSNKELVEQFEATQKRLGGAGIAYDCLARYHAIRAKALKEELIRRLEGVASPTQ